MSNKRQSTQLLEGVGSIKQVMKRFGQITNNYTGGSFNSQTIDPTTAVLSILDNKVKESIDGPRFDIIKGIFSKNTSSDSLATAYTLLTLDAMKTYETDFNSLFYKLDDTIEFSKLGLELLNNYRPNTSQIGISVPMNTNKFISRHIIQ
jgi:hypothetical protein